jgi:hypothetical protein
MDAPIPIGALPRMVRRVLFAAEFALDIQLAFGTAAGRDGRLTTVRIWRI